MLEPRAGDPSLLCRKNDQEINAVQVCIHGRARGGGLGDGAAHALGQRRMGWTPGPMAHVLRRGREALPAPLDNISLPI